MWLQFAEAVSERKTYRRCRHCDTAFEISLSQTGARTSRRFCTDACKNQFNYQIRVEARRLRAEKLSVRDIADRLDTTVASVRGWLKTPRTRRKGRGK